MKKKNQESSTITAIVFGENNASIMQELIALISSWSGANGGMMRRD
jgi:hypothetical protein